MQAAEARAAEATATATATAAASAAAQAEAGGKEEGGDGGDSRVAALQARISAWMEAILCIFGLCLK